MKKTVIFLMMIIVLISIVGCGKKQKTPTIKIGFMPSLVAVPYVYALEEGMYEEAGIKVEYVPFQKASDRDAALQAGEINAVSSDLVMILLNNENNIDMQFTVITEEVFRLISSPYYEKTEVSQTNGASVAISEMSVVEYLIERIEKSKSIDYNIVPIPAVPLRYAALTREPGSSETRVDLAIMAEPYSTMAVYGGGKEIWTNHEENHFVTVLGFKKDFIKKNPKVVKKFHEVTNDAIEILQTKQLKDYKHYIIEKGILTEEYLDEDGDKLVPMYPYNKLYKPSEEVFNSVKTWMKEKNYIKEEYKYQDLYYDAL